MVFEVLGCNLLKLIIRSNYMGIPLPNVKSIIRQVSFFFTLCPESYNAFIGELEMSDDTKAQGVFDTTHFLIFEA